MFHRYVALKVSYYGTSVSFYNVLIEEAALLLNKAGVLQNTTASIHFLSRQCIVSHKCGANSLECCGNPCYCPQGVWPFLFLTFFLLDCVWEADWGRLSWFKVQRWFNLKYACTPLCSCHVGLSDASCCLHWALELRAFYGQDWHHSVFFLMIQKASQGDQNPHHFSPPLSPVVSYLWCLMKATSWNAFSLSLKLWHME